MELQQKDEITRLHDLGTSCTIRDVAITMLRLSSYDQFSVQREGKICWCGISMEYRAPDSKELSTFTIKILPVADGLPEPLKTITGYTLECLELPILLTNEAVAAELNKVCNEPHLISLLQFCV